MRSSVEWALAILTVFSGSTTTVAQIDEFRNVDGKTIECLHSGLMSDLNDCDVRSGDPPSWVIIREHCTLRLSRTLAEWQPSNAYDPHWRDESTRSTNANRNKIAQTPSQSFIPKRL